MMASRRWWVALIAPLLLAVLVTAPAYAQTPQLPVPTTPQNLRANHIVAWGHVGGVNRSSGYSDPLTVTFPNT